MKIRILIDAKNFGGTETHVINLYKGLSARHDCQIIFACNYPNNPLYNIFDMHHIDYKVCNTYRELFNLLKTEAADIIHTHGYKSNILGRIAGFISKSSIIASYHAGEKPIGRVRLYDFVDRWSSFFSHNICVNQLIANTLPSRAQVIPNFVEMPIKINEIKEVGPYQIYFIGRVNPEKGPLRFGQLSELLAHPDYQCHMVGDGPLLSECQNQFKKTLQCHGAVNDMESIWPKVDLLCISSSYEGLPLVLLEAMSRGIPVVSFDVGSIGEVLTDPNYLIEKFNIQSMQASISTHFTKTPAVRNVLAESARNKILNDFSIAAVIPKIETFYQSSLSCQ